jgi:hypothetical protein
MADEVYSIATDFVALTEPPPDLSQLGHDIEASAITEPYQGAGINGDAVTFIFGNPLGAPDKAILDAIVAAHTGTENPLRYGGTGGVPIDAARAPTVNDDSTLGYAIGSVWCDHSETPCAIYVAVEVTPGAAEWSRVVLPNSGTARAKSIDLVFADLESGEGAGIRIGETVFQVLGYLVWRGTDVNGTPTAIKIVARAEGGTGKDITVRIVDVTNGGLVVASLVFDNVDFAILNMGALANLSTGEALCEIQAKRNTSGGPPPVDGRLAGVYVHF